MAGTAAATAAFNRSSHERVNTLVSCSSCFHVFAFKSETSVFVSTMSSRTRSALREQQSETQDQSPSISRDRPRSALGPFPLAGKQSTDAAPAWARQLIEQVQELKATSDRPRARSRSWGRPAIHTELEKVAHKDQYVFHKCTTSYFKAIQKRPAHAVKFAKATEALLD